MQRFSDESPAIRNIYVKNLSCFHQYQIVHRAMVVRNKIISILLLVCGGFHGKLARDTDDDPMLNKIATDVIEDVIQVVVDLAKELDQSEDRLDTDHLNVVDGFYSPFRIAGIDFELQAVSGKFRDFPSLRTTAKSKVTHYLSREVHYVNAIIPITFDTFEIYYEEAVVKVSDGWQRWNGDLKMKVRRNEFNLQITIEHIKSTETCRIFAKDVQTLQFTDADIDLSLEGFPALHLKNVTNEVRFGGHYQSLVVRRLLESYLSPETNTTLNPLYYCKFQSSLASIENILQSAKYADLKRRQHRRALINRRSVHRVKLRRFNNLLPKNSSNQSKTEAITRRKFKIPDDEYLMPTNSSNRSTTEAITRRKVKIPED